MMSKIKKQYQAGLKIYSESIKNKRKTDRIFDGMQSQLQKINKFAARELHNVLNSNLKKLDIEDGRVKTTSNNLAVLSDILVGVDRIQNVYIDKYKQVLGQNRTKLFDLSNEKTNKLNDIYESIGFQAINTELSTEALEQVEITDKISNERISSILDKWRNFVRDTFNNGVSSNVPIAEFKERFFQKNGHVKIGSSLDEESEVEALIRASEERTKYQVDQAQQNGYDCCWNSNPMDNRTKPECIEATAVGVVPKSQMQSDHGFPPRHICRCDLTFTRCEWKVVNAGINYAINESRLRLIDKIESDPKSYKKTDPDELYQASKDQIRVAKNTQPEFLLIPEQIEQIENGTLDINDVL